MGRCCQICFEMRPNEQFGGRGQRAIVCSKCRRLPKAVREQKLLEQEIFGFLEQSNISNKNIERLSKLESDAIAEVAALASLVNRIALVKPGRRRRWQWLWQHQRELLRESVNAGLIDPLLCPDEDPDQDFEWFREIDFLEDD